jgi:Rod binding domain-containing protein
MAFDFAPIAPPTQVLATQLSAAPPAPLSAAELARRGKIHDTAQSFEATFLSSMMQEMFEGAEASAPFGGGQAETMFRSVLTEAMAKQVVKAGGVGIAASVEREMLKMQGMK